MYGLITNVTAVEGQRDALIDILLENARGMPGCLNYVVAADADDPNGVWVTEVWDDPDAHQAYLQRATVQDAIQRVAPTLAAFPPSRTPTRPVGGKGIPPSAGSRSG